MGWQRPGFVRREDLDLVADRAELGHRRDNLVAHVFGVLLGRPAAVLEQPGQRVSLCLEAINELGIGRQQLLALYALPAARLDGRYALTDLLLVLERRRQDVAI